MKVKSETEGDESRGGDETGGKEPDLGGKGGTS